MLALFIVAVKLHTDFVDKVLIVEAGQMFDHENVDRQFRRSRSTRTQQKCFVLS